MSDSTYTPADALILRFLRIRGNRRNKGSRGKTTVTIHGKYCGASSDSSESSFSSVSYNHKQLKSERTLLRRIQALLLGSMLLTPLPAFASGADINRIFFDVLEMMMPVWIPVAVLVVTIAGVTLIFATEEGAEAKARSAIIAVVVGGMIIMLGGAIRFALFQGVGGVVVENTALVLTAESLGLIGWLSAMAGMVGVLFIIITAIRAVRQFGEDEEAYTKVRLALLHVIIGLIIIAVAGIISNSVTAGNPNPLMDLIIGKIQLVLLLITAIALLVLVYAGFRMVTSFGQEDTYGSSKSLVLRVVAGLAIILLSYIITVFVSQMFG